MNSGIKEREYMDRPEFIANYLFSLSDIELAKLYDEYIHWQETGSMLAGTTLSMYYADYLKAFGRRFAADHLERDFLQECALRFTDMILGDDDEEITDEK